jgi:hypothetical protein
VIRVSTVVLERVDIMKRLIVLPVLLVITFAMILASSGISSEFPPTSSAQAADQSSGTLSVYGVGSASGPAEELTLQLSIEYWEEMRRGEPETPAERVQPVIDTAIDAGIDEDAITASTGFSGYNGMVRVTIQLEDPDQDQIQALFEEIEDAIRYEELYIIHVGGYYEYDDCQTLESEAFEVAVDEARERAERLAEVLEVDLGEVIDGADESRTVGLGSLPASSCDPPATMGPMDYYSPMMGGYAPFDPDAEVEVEVVRVVQLTFETE